jgi:alkanesulfonate monooxygenase SsuD/methylene tetrahydromethanopterin reductase-like flavin-dependent oxidoreductase (luciferase family)
MDGFRAAARRGLNLLCMPILKGIDALAEDLAEYRRELEEHGHDPATRRVGMLIPWHVAPTRDEAFEASDAMVWYIRRQVNSVTPPDYKDAGHAEYRLLGQLARAGRPAEALQDLVDNTMVVVGDVETRASTCSVADAGVTDLLCQFQVGGLAHDRAVRDAAVRRRRVRSRKSALRGRRRPVSTWLTAPRSPISPLPDGRTCRRLGLRSARRQQSSISYARRLGRDPWQCRPRCDGTACSSR